MKYWIKLLLLSIGLFWFATANAKDDQLFYRYKDKDGNAMISNILPPDYVNEGYDMINENGDVVETISPKKSTTEIKKEEAQKQVITTQRTKEEEQQRQDEVLLQSYASQQDIERTRDDKLASIKILEDIVRENLHGLNKQLNSVKASLESYNKGKLKAPPSLQKTLNDTIRQIKENEDFLTRKVIEKQDIQNKYDLIIKRYAEIRARAEKNQEEAGPPPPPPPPKN